MWILVETPAALPGQCYFCGSAERKLYIDCGTSIEFYGALYICVDECLRSMAHAAKYLSPDLVSKILENQEILSAENIRLQQENLSLKTAVANLSEAISASSGDSVPMLDTNLYNESVDIVESHALATEQSSEGSSSLDSGERTPDESSDDEGMADVRTDVGQSTDSFNI